MAITSAGQAQETMINSHPYMVPGGMGSDAVGDNTDYGTETLSAHVAVTRPS